MTKHAPEFIEFMQRAAPRLQTVENLAPMSFSDLCDWVTFFWNRGTISYTPDLAAITLFRFLPRIEDFFEPAVNDPRGQLMLVEACAAEPINRIADLYDDIFARFGARTIVLWERGERTKDKAPRMYRWAEFEEMARKVRLWEHQAHQKQ